MLHQSIADGRELIGTDAARVEFGANFCRYSLSPVPDLSGPSLVQKRLYLPFTQAIARLWFSLQGSVQTHLAGAIIPDTGATCRLDAQGVVGRTQLGATCSGDRFFERAMESSTSATKLRLIMSNTPRSPSSSFTADRSASPGISSITRSMLDL